MISYQPVIGLEIHAELKTRTKMFCGCLNDPDETHPNLNICPICLGYPGTLPVINEEAVKKVILAGLALNCRIAKESHFDRKNYFYPDLPKGYQISQYQKPFCQSGYLEIENSARGLTSPPQTGALVASSALNDPGLKRIRINRIHLEEDTGRLQHDARGDHSLVDFNRAGVPLMELVTEPDLTSGQEVEEFAKKLRLLLRYLEVSEANMEKGQMRVEVNISLAQQPTTLGTKVEIKNLNSMRAAAGAVEYEIKRQTALLEEGKKVTQETRGWDENKQTTFSQRLKESAHDYRYFPEPDLPELRFSEEYLEKIRQTMPELPEQRRERFKKQYDLNDAQIEIFTIAKHLGDYYERVASELDVPLPKLPVPLPKLHWPSGAQGQKSQKDLRDRSPAQTISGAGKTQHRATSALGRLAANYIITEFPPLMQAVGFEIDDLEGFKIEPEAFAELIVMIFHEKLSSTAAKAVLKIMAETGLHPEAIAKEKNLLQVSDSGELQKAVKEVLAKNAKTVADYQKGKTVVLKFLIGQVMAATKGKANPQMVADILTKALKQDMN